MLREIALTVVRSLTVFKDFQRHEIVSTESDQLSAQINRLDFEAAKDSGFTAIVERDQAGTVWLLINDAIKGTSTVTAGNPAQSAIFVFASRKNSDVDGVFVGASASLSCAPNPTLR